MKKSLLFCTVMFTLTALAWPLQSPDQYLGFKLGSDRNLAHYNQIKAYFELLSRESPRVKTVTIGQNHQGQ